MWIVRPARSGDVAGIEQLARAQQARVSTLPQSPQRLAERIDYCQRSLSADPTTRGVERFLFVLEETDTGEILGTAGVDATAGNGQPFYTYRMDELIHASHELNVSNRVEVLYLSHELTGKTLLCTFAIADSVRNTPAFELLSRSRLLFIDQHRILFQNQLIVELQGIQDSDGGSPFWNSLGRHFFGMDFATADAYSAVISKTFLAELMPPHPIYVTLLQGEAQMALGQPHAATGRSGQLFQTEGFVPGRHVDIFDGGPTLEGYIDSLATLRNRRYCNLQVVGDLNPEQTEALGSHLVATDEPWDFRCILADISRGSDDAHYFPPVAAATLDFAGDSPLVLVPL